MKIYIIGSPGSGKTTLSQKLAKKYDTTSYELDKIIYDDENDHIKRKDSEVENLFQDILRQDSWIIEDVGREAFKLGKQESNIIYYLDVSKTTCYLRVIKRHIRQLLHIEKYNCPPTFKELKYMLKMVKNYHLKEHEKKDGLKEYHSKVKYIKNIKEVI